MSLSLSGFNFFDFASRLQRYSFPADLPPPSRSLDAHFETTGSDGNLETVNSAPSNETQPTMSSSTTTTPESDVSDVAATLAERGNRYGDFVGHARVTQRLKAVLEDELARRGKFLAPDQQEALEMIFHKIGRVVNGDPDYPDSWHDIAGYAKLVDDRLVKEQAK
jgi:hypothetical protein